MSRTQANQHSLEALSSSLRQLLNNATTLSYLRQWTSSAAALGALVKDSRSLRPLIVSSDLFELLCNSLSLYLRLLVAASTATTAAASTAAPLDAVELEVLLLLACAVLECRTLFGSQDSDRLLEVVDSSGACKKHSISVLGQLSCKQLCRTRKHVYSCISHPQQQSLAGILMLCGGGQPWALHFQGNCCSLLCPPLCHGRLCMLLCIPLRIQLHDTYNYITAHDIYSKPVNDWEPSQA